MDISLLLNNRLGQCAELFTQPVIALHKFALMGMLRSCIVKNSTTVADDGVERNGYLPFTWTAYSCLVQ